MKTPMDKRCNPHDSGVLSRLNFEIRLCAVFHGFGRDGRSGNTRRTSLRVFSTSRPPAALENVAGGFKSRKGA